MNLLFIFFCLCFSFIFTFHIHISFSILTSHSCCSWKNAAMTFPPFFFSFCIACLKCNSFFYYSRCTFFSYALNGLLKFPSAYIKCPRYRFTFLSATVLATVSAAKYFERWIVLNYSNINLIIFSHFLFVYMCGFWCPTIIQFSLRLLQYRTSIICFRCVSLVLLVLVSLSYIFA